MSINENTIFDVGAFNGLDGLILALKNPTIMVHAFEANPDLINEIKNNKKKIEEYKNIEIKNYKLNNLAVSDKNGMSIFNIARNPTVSSLNNFSKDIDKTWPGYKEAHCTVLKRIKIKTITLEDYCNENKIKKINYLHIDTQGNDLRVLRGLRNKINLVCRGVLEAAINKKKSLYEKNHTIDEVKEFLRKNSFKILKIENVDENITYEKNVYFLNNKQRDNKKLNTNYNLRYFNRIISNKLSYKDRIIDGLKNCLSIKF